MKSNMFKSNNRFNSLLYSEEKPTNSFEKRDNNSFEKRGNNYDNRNNYNNSFVNLRIKEEPNVVKEIIFSESLSKTKVVTEAPPKLNFLDKAKIGSTKEIIKNKPKKVLLEDQDENKNKIDPFFRAYLDAVTELYEKQEVEERARLGDDLYEEKYGINDENYIEYFDMLDEMVESDSDSDEEFE
jgi:hypothetical protein